MSTAYAAHTSLIHLLPEALCWRNSPCPNPSNGAVATTTTITITITDTTTTTTDTTTNNNTATTDTHGCRCCRAAGCLLLLPTQPYRRLPHHRQHVDSLRGHRRVPPLQPSGASTLPTDRRVNMRSQRQCDSGASDSPGV